MRRIKVIKMKLAIQQTVERQLVPNLLSLSEGGNMYVEMCGSRPKLVQFLSGECY